MLRLFAEKNVSHQGDQGKSRMFPFEQDASTQQGRALVEFLPYEIRVVQARRVVQAHPPFPRHHPRGSNRSNQIQNWHISSNLRRLQVLNLQPLNHLPPTGQPIRPQPSVIDILQEDTDAILLLNRPL